MIPPECKRLAEVDFPIAAVSKHAAREKSIRHGHPSTLHLWWARRPLASSRAVLLALLLPGSIPLEALRVGGEIKRQPRRSWCSIGATCSRHGGRWIPHDPRSNIIPGHRRDRQRAKGEREEAMRTHNLFISHSWSYSDQYAGLERLLRARSYFRFKDYSVPRNDPIHNAGTDAQLREAIRNKMAPCGVAIEPWGSDPTSARVKQAADRIVKWNAESVVGAIRELAG